jgi:hypothetical protein
MEEYCTPYLVRSNFNPPCILFREDQDDAVGGVSN